MKHLMLNLVNGTQHDQTNTPWASIAVHFEQPSFLPYRAIDPNVSLKKQIKGAWENLLQHIDTMQSQDLRVDGVLLGGYAPVVLALYQYLSNMRQRCYVAVMDEAPIVEGQRRTFVLGGCRSIPTPKKLRTEVQREGQPIVGDGSRHSLGLVLDTQVDHTRLIHVSARPLTADRRAELKRIFPQELIATSPVLPPPSSMEDLEDFTDKIADLAHLAYTHKCGILLDGPPAETMLHLYAHTSCTCLPFYFLKTEVKEQGKPAVPVSLEPVPRF